MRQFVSKTKEIEYPTSSYFRNIFRKFIIALLVLVFLNEADMLQILKIPVLLQHYNEHNQGNDSLSFVDFLYKHYHEDHNQADSRHTQLPFKSMQNHLSHSHWISIDCYFEIAQILLEFRVIHKFPEHSSSLSSAFCRPLIQPPVAIS